MLSTGFLRGIAFDARENDVKLAIANALHGGSFAEFGPEKINFDLLLHRNKRGGGGSHGSLTLPKAAIGNAFIRRYGSGQLSVNARSIIVALSNKPVRQNIVERLRMTKYRDPQSEAEQRLATRAETLSAGIDVVQIEQGWTKRDSSFLSEYAVELTETTTMALKFDDANRNIALSITQRGTLPWDNSTYYIKFRYSDIHYIHIDRHPDINVVLFQLRTPVSYEHESSQFDGLLSLADRRASRNRLSSLELDEKHASLAQYISRSILIRIGKPAATKFLQLCGIAQIAHPHRQHIHVVKSTMFAPSKTVALRRWIVNHKWEVAFQLERILSNMLLNPEDFLALKPEIDDLVRTSRTEHVVAVLLDFISRLEILDRDDDKDEMMNRAMRTAEQCLKDAKQKASKPKLGMSRLRFARRKGINGDFPCLHAVVTPTRVILEGPSPEQLNRVLRMYPDNWNNFLRVRFSDEEQSTFRWEQDVDAPAFVKKRIGGILKNGLVIAGRRFEYLGYSSSALKTHTVWFVRPFDLPGRGRQNAATIIQALGDFSRDSKYPARMGARIAQAFSSTDLSISVEELIVSPDIERNGSCFTDGVGTISPEVAKLMWRSLTKLRKRRSYFLPAAYQVRLGGHKGMLAIDYRLEGSVICVRKSMDKFDSPSLDVEVARAFDRPGPCFLNRPLIMILETANKIESEIFLRLQESAVQNTRDSMRTFLGASKLLEMHGLGASFKLPSILVRLQNIGLELEHCRSLGIKTALKDAETDVLRELKHRARIPVPDSWKLVGIADEFGYLKQGEIYACVRDKDEQPIYLEGPYMISRSPAIHPGDVQVVRAIGRPPPGTPFDIEPLANTVVLSCDGNRSLASCLGGGDLDGDLYDLINLTAWPELAPRELVEAAEYPQAPKKAVEGRDCNMDDVKDFICDFITSDMVGRISVQHLKMADYRPLGVRDPDCLKLAALHSKAVDFPKSGTPVDFKELPRTSRMPRPDWDAGELGFRNARDEVYQSQRALGQLYRAIQLSEDYLQHKGTHPSSRFGTELNMAAHAKPLERAKYDLVSHRLRVALSKHIYVDDVPREYFKDAVDLLEEYISELTRICNTYALTSRSILSEEEVVAGTILERTSQHRRRRDMISEMRTASTSLVANVKDVLRGSDSDELEDWMLRSWAAYQVARASEEFGHNSFGLLALGNAFEAVEAITQRELVR
ncbi:RdRP-domain-containing protein [Ceratobasidium sp. AG-I]|nr:RdRP-domain-containing protein [Ceratobasidium sp. AG-I]